MTTHMHECMYTHIHTQACAHMHKVNKNVVKIKAKGKNYVVSNTIKALKSDNKRDWFCFLSMSEHYTVRIIHIDQMSSNILVYLCNVW